MSQSFDPYHIWLGIPANESPPNHYRLLGLSLFESDADVIQHAIDQRMAHLKSLSTGRHVALSQRLLNEVARAGVCLLRPVDKQIYDYALRAAIAAVAQSARTETAASETPFAPAGPEAPPQSEPELSPDFGAFEHVLGAAARGRRDRGKRRRSSTRTLKFVAGTVLIGATGLVAIGLALFAVNPKHPLLEALAGIFRSSDEVARQEPPDASTGRSPKPEDRPSPSPPPQLATAQRPEDRRLPLPPARLDGAPQAEDRRSPLTPSQPDALPRADEPQPAPDVGRTSNAPKAAVPAAPPGRRTKVVLDLSQPVTHATLSEVAGGKAEIRVEDVTGLGTPFELTPGDGILHFGQRVDIVLKDYSGLRIGLSLHAKESAIVDVAPKMGAIAFTQRWATQAALKAKKDLDKANQQLEAAKTEAQNIDIWLKSPGTKPVALRGAKRQQLLVLKEQTIPALEKDANDLQTAANASQRLSQLAEQIHRAANIHFVVRSEAKEAAP